MAFDGLVLRGVAHELNQLLAGARLDKIAQPNKHEIIFHVRGPGKTHRLLLSALAQEARVHLTSTTPPNPEQPPVFCMVLRKHLEGGRILSFAQQGLDRILAINIQAMDEMGDLREKCLLAEIMGKHSNLILLDPATGTIIDSLHHIGASVSRYRQVLPGYGYKAPPARDKLPLWQEEEDAISPRLMALGMAKSLDQIVLAAYDGLGPLSAQELIHRAGFSPVDTLEYFGQNEYRRLWHVLRAAGVDLAANRTTPEIVYQENRPKDFSAIALTIFPQANRQTFGSTNEMLDAFYKDRGAANLFRQKQGDIEQVLRREQERCRKKAGLQAAAVLEGQAARQWQVYGQLLMANHYQLAQGDQAQLANFYEEGSPTLTIPLDPQISPLENAQAYFHRYQKARLTAEKAQVHYEDTMAELAYLDSMAHSLTTVTSLAELAEIRSEMQEAGYLKADEKGARGGGGNKGAKGAKSAKVGKGAKSGKGGKALKDQSNPKLQADFTFGQISIQGFIVCYGKNNKQNDYLTMKMARSGDLWLHAQKIPSAHVIIRNPEKRDIPQAVIEDAAKLCLWHSQARSAGRTAIDYTNRQNVWKPKGAKPGMVLYEHFQTMYVTVTEAEFRALIGPPANSKQGN